MLLAGKGRGLYVAPPTMATADAMFARARARALSPSGPFREVQAGLGWSDAVVCSPGLTTTAAGRC